MEPLSHRPRAAYLPVTTAVLIGDPRTESMCRRQSFILSKRSICRGTVLSKDMIWGKNCLAYPFMTLLSASLSIFSCKSNAPDLLRCTSSSNGRAVKTAAKSVYIFPTPSSSQLFLIPGRSANISAFHREAYL